MIQCFAKDFNVKVGLPDHMLGYRVPFVANALEETIVEKHFILDKFIGGLDASFSLDEKEFAEMVTAVRRQKKPQEKKSYEFTKTKIR
jgi:pseudaminic acid synthase